MIPPERWNATRRDFRSTARIGDLVLDAARHHPDATALRTGDAALSYRELTGHAVRLAHLLRSAGVGPGEHVAVVGRRTPGTVIAMLGIALSGAAFVPVDPQWPVARRRRVLEQMAPRRVVGTRADLRWLPAGTELVELEAPARLSWSARADVQRVWDEVVRSSDPVEAAGFNLSGSRRYTPAEVAAYGRHVAGLVLAESPGTVLEIGVGSGVVLREVAPHVDLYAGLDPAPAAVAANLAWAARHGLFVDLVEGFAEDVDAAGFLDVDVAVLASTVQYFPDEDYLLGVLELLAGVLRSGGVVVLADLIPPGTAPVGGLFELSPAWFETLGGSWRAQVLERGPGLPGELAARYDVVLRHDPAADRAGRPVWTGADLESFPTEPPDCPAAATDVAYVIFTSGSTGDPKGVVVAHRSLVNVVEWVNREHGVGPGDVLLQVCSFSFDLSVYDVFGVLAAGGTIRLADGREVAEPVVLADLLVRERVTFWDSAPAMLGWVLPFLVPADRTPAGRDALRLVFLSGDWIPVAMPDEIRERFPRARVVSLGGATEATIWSNHYPVGEVDPDWPSIPYGWPIQNARYYVLGPDGRSTPVGEPGDLHIAGPCLALGYHGDPALTHDRFRPDPGHPGELVYATGDRARWRRDGTVEFLGRLDSQVKVRGFRVELGEVEAAMSRVGGVRAAAAVAVPAAGDRLLAGFFTAREPGTDPAAVRAVLTELLPAYMVPARLEQLAALPLTANGKVDRDALARLAAG